MTRHPKLGAVERRTALLVNVLVRRELPVPNQPGLPPQENWAANSSVLRRVMNEGNPIRDVSLDAEGNPAKNTGFLRAERNLLENHGWSLHSDGYWHPPQR
jgi:hypothetical protein